MESSPAPPSATVAAGDVEQIEHIADIESPSAEVRPDEDPANLVESAESHGPGGATVAELNDASPGEAPQEEQASAAAPGPEGSATTADDEPGPDRAPSGPKLAGEPAGPKAVVVLPLSAGSDGRGDSELGRSVAEVLSVALGEAGKVRVVERQALQQVLDEQKLTAAGLVDPATAARVGQLLGAEIAYSGSVTQIGDQVRVSVQAIAVEGQRVLSVASREGSRDEIERVVLEVVRSAASAADLDLPPLTPEQLDDSPVGRLHLMRGIGLHYAGNQDEAISYLLRAVHLDPRLQEARLWIAKAYLAENQRSHARAELLHLLQGDLPRPLADEARTLLKQCN